MQSPIPYLTPEQLFRRQIERYAILRQMSLICQNPQAVLAHEQEMLSLEQALNMTGSAILQKRVEIFKAQEETERKRLQWGISYNPEFANDIGAA